jgi:uncharacterized protein YecE (DUF72 family)
MGELFPPGDSHLERYAQVFSCAEINSSFYRSHRQNTWERWARAVPATFRFAVKAPKTITHESELNCTEEDLKSFLGQAQLLGNSLGPILFQTPPSLVFESEKANRIFSLLRGMYDGPVAIEPRHVSWFAAEVDQHLSQFEIARVAADPAPTSAGKHPGGTELLSYYRLHGTPRKYYSSYSDEILSQLAESVRGRMTGGDVWVIFDNTASGAAAGDALRLHTILDGLIAPSQNNEEKRIT